MKNNNLKLGRGMNELLEENKQEWKSNEEVLDIELERIIPNPEQPRTIFNETSLQELADSIKEHGVFQPVILKPFGNQYILVAGERRVKASKIAGKTTVPSIIREYNSIYLTELAILENLQREDLTPIEEAIALQKALYNLNLTHAELGKKIGKSRVYVTNMVGLLRLPSNIIHDVNMGKISMGHARVLSKIKDQITCMELHQKIIEENLTVRDIETVIRNLNNKENIISKNSIEKAKHKLSNNFTTKFHYKLKKNQLVFQFENEKELMELINHLVGDET